MQGLNDWDKLRELKFYSLERRRERYIAIYNWQILEGHVTNFGSALLITHALAKRASVLQAFFRKISTSSEVYLSLLLDFRAKIDCV